MCCFTFVLPLNCPPYNTLILKIHHVINYYLLSLILSIFTLVLISITILYYIT